MKAKIIYNYDVSFECGKIGDRIRVEQQGSNITEVIKEVRRDYPDAHMFIIVKKKRQG